MKINLIYCIRLICPSNRLPKFAKANGDWSDLVNKQVNELVNLMNGLDERTWPVAVGLLVGLRNFLNTLFRESHFSFPKITKHKVRPVTDGYHRQSILNSF